MKKILFILLCAVVVGCARKRDPNRELMSKLDDLRAEVAKQPAAPPRWAVANKREIESTISQWTTAKGQEAKEQEHLTPEQQQKVAQYDSLQSELLGLQMRLMHAGGFSRGPMNFDSYKTNAEYVALSGKVAEARAPVGEIVQRRERLSAKVREQFKAADLIAEYAKDRFDLVVDTSDAGFSRSPVVYQRTGEVTDITEGVIKLFKQKNN